MRLEHGITLAPLISVSYIRATLMNPSGRVIEYASKRFTVIRGASITFKASPYPHRPYAVGTCDGFTTSSARR